MILAAYGAGRVPAVSAALVFRLVSYWLVIAVGWASFGVMAITQGGAPARACRYRPMPDMSVKVLG